jgi:hypothetical protein
MAAILININLSNIPQEIDANELANMIEGIVRNHARTEVVTDIYDSDGTNTMNPIYSFNTLKKIERK